MVYNIDRLITLANQMPIIIIMFRDISYYYYDASDCRDSNNQINYEYQGEASKMGYILRDGV